MKASKPPCILHFQERLQCATRTLLEESVHLSVEQLHDIQLALTEPGKLFAPFLDEKERVVVGAWALLPLLTATSLHPETNLDQLLPPAIALEFFVLALDILDDFEDPSCHSLLPQLLGGRALNVSTTLLGVVRYLLYDYPQVQMAFDRTLMQASRGQHMDLVAQDRPIESCTYQEYLKWTAEKSGSLAQLAFEIGALCGKATPHQRELLNSMGIVTGMFFQLSNDLQEGLPSIPPEGRVEKTLPLILAATHVHPPVIGWEQACHLALQEATDMKMACMFQLQEAFQRLQQELGPCSELAWLLLEDGIDLACRKP
jgi:hypothetical protein